MLLCPRLLQQWNVSDCILAITRKQLTALPFRVRSMLANDSKLEKTEQMNERKKTFEQPPTKHEMTEHAYCY